MVIAATYMGVNCQIVRLIFDGCVVQAHAKLANLLDVIGLQADLRCEGGVAVHAPGAVVELDVAASRFV